MILLLQVGRVYSSSSVWFLIHYKRDVASNTRARKELQSIQTQHESLIWRHRFCPIDSAQISTFLHVSSHLGFQAIETGKIVNNIKACCWKLITILFGFIIVEDFSNFIPILIFLQWRKDIFTISKFPGIVRLGIYFWPILWIKISDELWHDLIFSDNERHVTQALEPDFIQQYSRYPFYKLFAPQITVLVNIACF